MKDNKHLEHLTLEQKLAYETYRREVNACQSLHELRLLVLELLSLNFNQTNTFKEIMKGDFK